MTFHFGSTITTSFDQITTYLSKNAICFFSDALDERGTGAIEMLKEVCKSSFYLKYDDAEFHLQLNETTCKIAKFIEYIKSIKNDTVIVEATTLSFAEIIYIFLATLKNDYISKIQILYIEPNQYKFKSDSITTYDDFDLSEQLKAFPPLPKFTINVEDSPVPLIAFLGFENARVGQIFSADEGAYNKFMPVIPLPGFSPGWENRTINNHLKFFDTKYFFDRLRYVSANNPYQAYSILEEISSIYKKFRLAPLGTKPNAIGCAIFLVNQYKNHSLECGALFDYPIKTSKRSVGIGKVHIYNLTKK